MKALLFLTTTLLVSLAQAKTVSCFTKFFGNPAESTLSILLDVAPSLTFETKSIKIDGKAMEFTQRTNQGTVVSGNSRYAGMLRFGLGYVNDYDGYTLELTIPNKLSGRFNGFVTLRDGHGGSKYNLLCEAR